MVIAVCIYCKKRFTSVRGISMHLKAAASRHIVNFITLEITKRTGILAAHLGLY